MLSVNGTAVKSNGDSISYKDMDLAKKIMGIIGNVKKIVSYKNDGFLAFWLESKNAKNKVDPLRAFKILCQVNLNFQHTI